MALAKYTPFLLDESKGLHDFLTGDYRMLLLNQSAVFDATMRTVSQVIDNELLGGGGYARVALTGKTLTTVGATVVWNATSPIAFGSPGIGAGQTIKSAVLFRFVTDDAGSLLVAWYDGGTAPNDLPHATDGRVFNFNIPAGGLLVKS